MAYLDKRVTIHPGDHSLVKVLPRLKFLIASEARPMMFISRTQSTLFTPVSDTITFQTLHFTAFQTFTSLHIHYGQVLMATTCQTLSVIYTSRGRSLALGASRHWMARLEHPFGHSGPRTKSSLSRVR